MTLTRFAAAALLAAAPFLSAHAQQQHAHVHGQLKLDVAIDGPTVVIDMDSPLDNIVGFERAPRTDAEKKTAEDAIAQLRAADKLFVIDPAANCKLGPVDLRSSVLGLGTPTRPSLKAMPTWTRPFHSTAPTQRPPDSST